MKIIDFNDRMAQKRKEADCKDWYDNGMDAMSRIGRDDADKIVKFVLGYLLNEGYRKEM
jgi:hypothetical protein